MKILVVEDNAATLKMLETLLEKWGYEVVTAMDGNQALAVINAPDSPRLVLLDWMVPEMSGLDLCKKIRASSSGIETSYVILLTAKTGTEDIVTGLQAGADDYIAKPFEAEELRVRINAGKRIVELQTALNRRGKAQGVLELAGAVCHELNQPLQTIMGHVQMMQMEMENPDAFEENLTIVKEQVDRMAELTRKLMRITRYETREYVPGTRIVDIDKSTGPDQTEPE